MKREGYYSIVKGLHAKGYSAVAIARLTSSSHTTVRRVARRLGLARFGNKNPYASEVVFTEIYYGALAETRRTFTSVFHKLYPVAGWGSWINAFDHVAKGMLEGWRDEELGKLEREARRINICIVA